MDRIIAVTFDMADQKCKMYNALEWHNFIADSMELASEYGEEAPAELEELFEECYGDEFWFETVPSPFAVYDVAFDLRSEEFVICGDDNEIEFVMEMARDSGDEDEIFWSE